MEVLNKFQRQQSVLLLKHHRRIKLMSILMLVISGSMFIRGGIGYVELPDFAKYTDWDIWVWASVSYSLALIQLFTLVHRKCRSNFRWANTVLIISGFVLLIIGCLFGFKYPPHAWQMTVYPFVGFLFTVVGRKLNKLTQRKDRKNEQNS